MSSTFSLHLHKQSIKDPSSREMEEKNKEMPFNNISEPADMPRRKFPPFIAYSVEPNSEYTEYGDILFAAYGMNDDGSLALQENWSLETMKKELELTRQHPNLKIPRRKNRPPPPVQKDLKWPLTHRECIAELEEWLSIAHEEDQELQGADVKNAIEYHRGFDLDTLCEERRVWFINGKVFKDVDKLDNLPPGLHWVEVTHRRSFGLSSSSNMAV